MNSAEYVTKLIEQQKAQGLPLQQVAWNAALACVGWAYVFGARWQYCTPANRRARYSAEHPTIKTKCKNYNGTGTSGCTGCQWLPCGMLTRINDCRGFTYGILKAVYNWELIGAGCTSQWNDDKNWKIKGTIDGMPVGTLVCLFVRKGNTMEHTGFGFNNETVECSSGVQYFKARNKKWTHYGVPACIDFKPQPIPEGYAVVTGKQVALRKDASTSATIITRIKTGERVKLETAPHDWDYVSYSGRTGYMMREFLREEGDKAVVTGKQVALRVDPCTRAKIIMRIKTGESVKLEAEPESKWDYVSYQSKTGYMMKEFLKEG